MEIAVALIIASPGSSRCVCAADQHSAPPEHLCGHPVLDGSRGKIHVPMYFISGMKAVKFCISALSPFFLLFSFFFLTAGPSKGHFYFDR